MMLTVKLQPGQTVITPQQIFAALERRWEKAPAATIEVSAEVAEALALDNEALKQRMKAWRF